MGAYDAIVVGAGIQGTCAAYHLAKRGQKTLLLEQFPLPHSRGSSHGQSRIIRSAYPQDYYAAMMAEACHLWKQLEGEAGTRLFRPTPMVVLGARENPEFQSYWQSMRRNGIPCEVLTPEAVAQRFPGIRLSGEEMAVADQTAGVLYADRALKSIQEQFKRNGGTVRDAEKVLTITPGPVATVVTSQGEYRAARLVVTAGAWADQLLAPLGLRLPLQPLRINVCYWRGRDQAGAPDNIPCFVAVSPCGDQHHVYGLPADEYPGLVKVCYHHGTPVDPDAPDVPDRASPAGRDVQLLRDFVSKYLPGLDPEPAVLERCMYTNTPDQDFVIDRHPRFRNVVVAAGFSGHGFKFSPVVGKLLCQLCLEEEPSYDLAPFRMSRFPGTLGLPGASL